MAEHDPTAPLVADEASTARGYPVTLRLAGRTCVVVGGGAVAARKVAGLVAAGAAVRVVAPRIAPAIRATGAELVERVFDEHDVAGAWLVVTATGVASVDAAVQAACERAGVLVNAADNPGCCSVILPAVLRRGRVSVAVSTDGLSPALSSLLRDKIAEALDAGVGLVAEALGTARRELHAAGRSTEGLPWKALAERLLATQADGDDPGALDDAVNAFLAEAALRDA